MSEAIPSKPTASRHYDVNYGNFQTDLYAQIRRDAFGDDIGQSSWLTSDEQDRFLSWLNLSPGKSLLDIAADRAVRCCESRKVLGARCRSDVHDQAIAMANSLAAQRPVRTRRISRPTTAPPLFRRQF